VHRSLGEALSIGLDEETLSRAAPRCNTSAAAAATAAVAGGGRRVACLLSSWDLGRTLNSACVRDIYDYGVIACVAGPRPKEHLKRGPGS